MIYLIVDERNEFCKIGKSKKTKERINDLQTGNPLTLRVEFTLDISDENESILHKQFKRFHKRGEWFHYNTEIREYFEKLEKSNLLEKIQTLDISMDYRIDKIIEANLFWTTNKKDILKLIKSTKNQLKLIADLYEIAISHLDYKTKPCKPKEYSIEEKINILKNNVSFHNDGKDLSYGDLNIMTEIDLNKLFTLYTEEIKKPQKTFIITNKSSFKK